MAGEIDCSEVMTKELTVCFPSDTVVRAAQLMAKHHVGAVPVVDDENNRALLGIVTDRDITLRVVAHGHDAKNIKVTEVMTRDVVTCAPAQNVREAIDIMADRQLRRLPVG